MSDETNGRVTMAILSTKLDAVIDRLDALTERYNGDHDQVTRLTTIQAETARALAAECEARGGVAGEVKRAHERIDGLSRRDVIWNGINSALVLIGSALGITRGPTP